MILALQSSVNAPGYSDMLMEEESYGEEQVEGGEVWLPENDKFI